ncbi:porin [Filomicrobium sp.]|uniref:porin n=1 Tax=Filomicrobium sp. TaxID=2024831 RepID=UPI002589F75E|nr:porin [Filomicrobium sp.]MCV0368093.1 porin [Filomicrobium sp.]
MSFRVFGAALLLSTAAVTSNAFAADLGGDCCADLEERVSELEATTARKGNRKVSLEIYGQVNTAVMFWDNGKESNAYVVDNDISSTRFGFKGKAKISPDWSAGFKIEIETQLAASNEVDENNDDGPQQINLRKAEWYLKSKTYGQVTVGQGSFASDGASHVDLSGTNVIAQFDDLKFGEKIDPRSIMSAGGQGDYDDYTRGGSYEYNRGNRVRYDTPTIGGFVASAAWGEDDAWDVALRYATEAGAFKFAAAVAYGQFTDGTGSLSNDNVCESPAQGGECQEAEIVTGSASLIHTPTGLFVTAGAARREFDNIETLGAANEENTWWGVRAGISQKFFSLGKTALYGEYQLHENDNFRGTLGLTSEAEIIGAGIVQKIDAAAMELYLGYRHVEVDDNDPANSFDDLDVVTAGARIKF